MAWNTETKRLAFKAIGTVESSLKYNSINYNDPITVGVMQWFGTRAADILNRMRLENPSSWTGVAASIANDLRNKPTTSTNRTWWENRHLTLTEGESLRPVLNANAAIQVDQFDRDCVPYLSVARQQGIDPETRTDVFIFWMSMHHQSPKRARQVAAITSAEASLEKWLNNALNNEILSGYPTRYKTVYQIIKSGDASGVPDISEPVEIGEAVGDGALSTDSGEPLSDDRLSGRVKYVQLISPSEIVIHFPDDAQLSAYWDGVSTWTSRNETGRGVEPSPETPPPPAPSPSFPDVPAPTPPPPSSDADARRARVVKWLRDRIGKFDYLQGPGRLTPDKSGKSDCSGVVYAAYNSIGINIGSGSTRSQVNNGTKVYSANGRVTQATVNAMLPGDLIYMALAGGTRITHVEMYCGGGKIIGHGGVPRMGPTERSATSSFTSCSYHNVRRHI